MRIQNLISWTVLLWIVANVGVLVKAKNEVDSPTDIDAKNIQDRSDDPSPLEAVIAQQAAELSALKATLQTVQTDLSGRGSTFVRWGRTVCPAGSEIIYTGYAGGAGYTNTGSGANRVCLTDQPVFDNEAMMSGGHGNIHGAQYYVNGHKYTDVMCVLCRTHHSTTFLVPGTNRCPAGTTMQYHGYLSVGDYTHAAPSEYLCLDANPEDRPGSADHHECAYFDQAIVVCGSLPCPPYVSGKVTTCAVCSK